MDRPRPPPAWPSDLRGRDASRGACTGAGQITARNADGATPGPVWSFNTGAGPQTPRDRSPDDGAENVPLDAVLGWAVTEGAKSYAVRFGTENPPPLVSLRQTTPAYYPAPLKPDTTYYWQVIAVNPFGGTPGPVWAFRTRGGAPRR